MPRSQPSWLLLHSKRSILSGSDQLNKDRSVGETPAGRFLRAKSSAAGERKGTFFCRKIA